MIGLQRVDRRLEKEFLLDGLQEEEPLQTHNFGGKTAAGMRV